MYLKIVSKCLNLFIHLFISLTKKSYQNLEFIYTHMYILHIFISHLLINRLIAYVKKYRTLLTENEYETLTQKISKVYMLP